MSKINLIIPAAGTSNRFQSTIPKQFHVLNGKTILEHTLSAFKDIQLEDCLIAVNKNTEEKVHDIFGINILYFAIYFYSKIAFSHH